MWFGCRTYLSVCPMLLFIIIATAMDTVVCIAAPVAAAGRRQLTVQNVSPPSLLGLDVWMSSDMSGADGPYATIRSNIDSEFKEGVRPAEILRRAESAYPASFAPANVFARGYAAMLTWRYFDIDSSDDNDAASVVAATQNTICGEPQRYPESYNFIRLAFELLGDYYGGKLKTVGEKLLARDPNDTDVKEALISVLLECRDSLDRTKANKLANELIVSRPGDFLVYSVLARVQLADYQATHDVRFARLAISSYRTALALERVGPGQQKYDADRIADIEKLIPK